MTYLCHGSAVTITISLISKLMDNDQLGMDIIIFPNLLILLEN